MAVQFFFFGLAEMVAGEFHKSNYYVNGNGYDSIRFNGLTGPLPERAHECL